MVVCSIASRASLQSGITSAVKATLLKKTPLRLRFYLEHQIVLNLPHLLALMESRGKTWEQALKSWYIIFFQVPALLILELI